ncbi:MAG TPA: metal-dependent hydrolase [Candidatus Sulfotelmatobacter sp.]|nr:metal-dependent hydrolase [Candidatus Sulfotelmatobacter sp.]
MFIGHFAVGFAAKKFAPRASAAVLLAAPLICDMLWPFFLLLGWERARIDPGNTRFTPLDLEYYPWSHSLLMTVAWASAFSLIYYLIARYRPGAVAVWIGVTSHWVLDWITHRPDMPLYPGGGPRLGLGLWNSIAGTLIVELLMFAVGVGLYGSATRARDRIGRYAFAVYVGLLLLLYIGDRFSGPPPNVSDIAWSGILAIVILIPWAWWFDAHRTPRDVSGVPVASR